MYFIDFKSSGNKGNLREKGKTSDRVIHHGKGWVTILGFREIEERKEEKV